MSKRFLPIFLALLLSLGFVGSQVHAEGFCYQCPSSCAPCQGSYNAPYICEEMCSGFFVSADFLWWRASEDNLQPAVLVDFYIPDYVGGKANKTRGATGEGLGEYYPAPPVFSDVSVIKMNWEYKAGFRVRAGTEFGCDHWIAYADYTWFHQDYTKSTEVDEMICSGEYGNGCSQQFIGPIWLSGFDIPFIAFEPNWSFSADAKWKLCLDILDVEIARNYYVGCELLFRPHFGLRGAWIDQDFDVDYFVPVYFGLESHVKENEIELEKYGEYSGFTLYSNNSSSSWGVGPRAGLDTFWMLCDGMYLMGNVGVSLLYTEYDYKSDQASFQFIPHVLVDYTEDDSWQPDLFLSIPTIKENNRETLRPELDMAIGLGFNTCSCGMSWDFSLGYEFLVFWNQNIFRFDKPLNNDQSNLYFHGLNLSASVGF